VKPSLAPGLEGEVRFVVTEAKTVPALYPEAPGFVSMPAVFATGYMVGMVEWACIEAIAPHLEPGELSLGVHVDLSHSAATPVGMAVVARVRLEEMDGRRLTFAVEVDDERDRICEGRHQRFVIDRARFEAGVERKRAEAAPAR
jgi:fluoroacetyl-CoA thioesterase